MSAEYPACCDCATEENRGTFRDALAPVSCALAIYSALLASTTPSPLYSIYIRELGLPQSAGTTIFAVYAIGTLLMLFMSGLLVRRVRDLRTILIPGLILTALGAILFALADSLWMLILGRLLSGVSTGLITGTASSALLNLYQGGQRGRAALVATVAFTGGAASGPVFASLALALDLAPLVTPFVIIAAFAFCAAVGLIAARWPNQRPAGPTKTGEGTAPLRMSTNVKPFLRVAELAITAAWMLGSMLMAIGVSLAGQVFHLNIHALAGLLPAVFQLFAGIGQVVAGRHPSLSAIRFGFIGLALLQLLLFFGAIGHFGLALILAMPLCGFCYGAAFVGGAALVNEKSTLADHSRNISRFYVVGYLANAVPTYALGKVIDISGMEPAFLGFVAILCLISVVGAVLAMRLDIHAKDARQ